MASAAPRTTPLTMVSAAVAGDDLKSVASSVSDALGRPIAIALPGLGAPVVWPPNTTPAAEIQTLAEHAAAIIRGECPPRPAALEDFVPIRIGHQVVGVVAALGTGRQDAEQRRWLEAAAAAAAVAALIRDSHGGDLASMRHAFISALVDKPPGETGTLLAQARRLGLDLSAGVVAICARAGNGREFELPEHPSALLAEITDARVLGLVQLATDPAPEALAAELVSRGMEVALSAPRHDPARVHEALREAELMLELGGRPKAMLPGQDETYRLLVGVLLRDAEELAQLRARTVSPLARYDSEHDTELLATLQAFLAHHGSTTETAEAMGLHRHTVGYRLARVYEVSGLSPYESDGRERLSLGLKAHEILEADRCRPRHE